MIIENKRLMLVTNEDLTAEGHFDCPNDIEYIGPQAFVLCSELTSANLPDSVTTLQVSAFFNCRKLKSISLPGIKVLPKYLFNGCTQLEKISLLEGIEEINDYAFSSCFKLGTLNLPEGVVKLGSQLFDRCNLNTLLIPKSLTTICSTAFLNCNIEHIIIKSWDEEEINRIRSLFPQNLKDKLGNKFRCLRMLLNIKEALTNSGLPTEIAHIIAEKTLRLQFFNPLIETKPMDISEDIKPQPC